MFLLEIIATLKARKLSFFTLWLAVLHSAKKPLKMDTVVDNTINKLIPALSITHRAQQKCKILIDLFHAATI